jgi:hypothetical protein
MMQSRALPLALAGLLALALATAGLLVSGPGTLLADGGTLRLANVPMGAYRVNVYTDPTPIPPDTIDVSILVTYERGRGNARGLEIQVEALPVEAQGAPVRQPATREQAEDPRFYAAKFALGALGSWEITVRLRGPEGEGEASFRVEVQEPGPFRNPWVILTLALLPLVLVGWWLRSSGTDRSGKPEVSSPSTRPGG